MSNADPCMTSTKHDWQTPLHILEMVRDVFQGPILLDPAAPEGSNPTRANVTVSKSSWTVWKSPGFDSVDFRVPSEGGLISEWNERNAFVNPPFGTELPKWTAKVVEEVGRGVVKELILLTPARTDTVWWNRDVLTADAVAFVRGRLRYRDPSGVKDGVSTFPSALSYWGPKPFRFLSCFESIAWCVKL